MKPSESSDTLRNTKTERQKAKIITRCIVNILKMFRICCREKDTKKNMRDKT